MLVALALALSPFTQDSHAVGATAPVPARPVAPPRSAAMGGPRDIEVLLTNVPGAIRNEVPGLPGVAFDPGVAPVHFDRVYGHPGGHWVLTALADLAPTEDEVLIVDGQLVIREGDPAPWTGGTELCGTLDQRVGVNASGAVVFATNSSASSNDDYVVSHDAGNWTVYAREGDPIPGLPGATFDDRIDSALIVDDGRVGCAADGIDGTVSTSEDDVLLLGASVLAQKGVTVPPGQAGSAPAAIEDFDLGDFWASADGQHWMVQCDLDGALGSDDVVLVDGNVVLQEGVSIPGSSILESIDEGGIFGVSMDAAGHWYARGDVDGTGLDWVVRDGEVVARTGAPVVPGSTEHWDDARFSEGFFAHVGNAAGSWVVAGTTDEADPALDAVVVLDGHAVVVRESDPVDLDGDGAHDDDVFIDTFGTDDFFLTDDLDLYMVARLKDGSGHLVGQALLRAALDPGVGTGYCGAAVNSTGRPGALLALGSARVTDDDLRLRAFRLPPSSHGMFFVSRMPGSIPNVGGSQGTMCLAGTIDRFLRPGDFGSTGLDGAIELRVDLAAIPQPSGPVAGLPGDTWYFQCWYRDSGAGGAATTNFTNGVEVTLE
ncbi:MAG: hypothetical protein AAF957_04040 [Planctomycetota bacterium]